MQLVTETEQLARFCGRAARAPYVAIDTEFEREGRYFSKLCLIQLAIPGGQNDDAVIADPLAAGLSLEPLDHLLSNTDVTKVFHAGRQDIEIFFTERGIIPTPLFDTQIAGMVCGLGNSAGFATLLRVYGRTVPERSEACTDWKQRPLSKKQLQYAIDDVVLLCPAYEAIQAELERGGRTDWIADELATLGDPDTFRYDPVAALRGLKLRNAPPETQAAAIHLLRMRDALAKQRNVPRNRVLRDDHLTAIAKARPTTAQDLRRNRLLPRSAKSPPLCDHILAAVRDGASEAPAHGPEPSGSIDSPPTNHASLTLIRTLLEERSRYHRVAPHLIATAADMKALARGQPVSRLSAGWRFDLFGQDAMRLHAGTAALMSNGSTLKVIAVNP